jgi:hypothetical protein
MTVTTTTHVAFYYEKQKQEIDVNMSFKEAQEHFRFPSSYYGAPAFCESVYCEWENYTFNLSHCKIIYIRSPIDGPRSSKITKLVLNEGGVFNLPGTFNMNDLEDVDDENRINLTDDASFKISFRPASFISLTRC